MKDDLKRFAKDNRPSFDTKKIDAGVWNRIAEEMKHGKKRRGLTMSIFWKRVAAAMLVLIVSASVFYFYHSTSVKKNDDETIVQKHYPEYASKISSFAVLIDNKKEELKSIEQAQPDIYRQFNSHISGLNAKYEDLKKEFISSPNKSFLLNEMIDNLELHVRLLNTQLELINQLKESMKSGNEKIIKNI
jgi:hypothetical protein